MFDNSNNGIKGDDVSGHRAEVIDSTDTTSDYERIQLLIINCATEAGHNVHFFDHGKPNDILLIQPIYRHDRKFCGPNEKQIFCFFRLLKNKFNDSEFKLKQNDVINARTNIDSPNLLCISIQLTSP